ncbi:acyl transferase domain-containing protein/thioesterase domain-containing protein [Limimaricola variabilis]|uniref:Acyl transferase domain-containing protein/thioesterase domain-containing protein n=1 Tax=Limimaricola variabilis TaxID=1492771 RepID=A0ABR6HRW2_9RHOB|nr:type I polyketide synthase [Limimaricola variabilis]MBB3713099.1 acyl transferase domain-containing protein/thioesterase domain-containing protein [Limimaricola variabilis]
MAGAGDLELGDIAITGMAVDLPGAGTLDAFWEMLRERRSAIRRLTPEEMARAGADTAGPDHVPYGAPLDSFDKFDASFFGLSPRDAAIMDPQHRRFIETAWAALENAGHVPEHFDGAIGVYAGCGPNEYFNHNVMANAALVESAGPFLLRHTGNDKDFLATRLAHMLDLTGPAVSVQTACSTSLVAVHMAAQALLTGECDMALAGGVTILSGQGRGHRWREGDILSPDGQCRAFDHRAAGTVFGSGAAAVVLRRLEDALNDGDHVWAVLKGSAINNDGSRKASYLAPSVEGQARAVAAALRVAGVGAESLGFVECHGTGTPLGDPIEVAALTRAFRETTDRAGYCRIGSVKTGIGHTDTAAGAASLVKAALALHHRTIPGMPHFEAPNPALALEGSPFEVAAETAPWPHGAAPRRAGVNSLGVGGTNAHAVLEEAPARAPAIESDWPFQLIRVSGRSRAALQATAAQLAAHLRAHPEQPLADVAHTLATGRRALRHRRVLLADSHEEATRLLEAGGAVQEAQSAPEIVFMLPGGGAQQPGMGHDLYETEPVFRDWMDRGFAAMGAAGAELRELWAAAPGEEAEAAAAALRRPSRQLPLLMIVSHALAQLWIGWGVRPDRLIGHSMGENLAAVLAGVMSFEEGLGLVRLRGALFEETAPGAMLSVPLTPSDLRAELGPDLDIAAINAPELCVASGPVAAIEALAERLATRGIETRRVPIEVAAHSRLLDPILPRFEAHLRDMTLSPPGIPIVSNRSGVPLTDAEATDPAYWVGHLRHMVDFDAGLHGMGDGPRICIEMGSGGILGALAALQPGIGAGRVLPGLRPAQEPGSEDRWMILALGRLWAMGGRFDEAQLAGEGRRRLPLPGYALERERHWVEPDAAPGRIAAPAKAEPVREDDIARWAWQPGWRRRYPDGDFEAGGDLAALPPETWLVLCDETGLGDALVARLRAGGHRVATVVAGPNELRRGPEDWQVPVGAGEAPFARLVAALEREGMLPDRVLHLWTVTGSGTPGLAALHVQAMQERGYWSLLHLARAWHAAQGDRPLRLVTVSSDAQAVTPQERPDPAKATLAGPAMVIGRELPGIGLSWLDISAPSRATRAALAEAVLEEAFAAPEPAPVSWRNGVRRRREPLRATLPETPDLPLRPGGAVLITGGLGGIGLTLAETLARNWQAGIAMVSRRTLPPRADWPGLAAGGARQAELLRALLRLEAMGARIEVLRADVTDPEEMREAVAEAEARLGPLSGVIHAAGRLDDAPVLGRSPEASEAVIGPKLQGLMVLDTLFPDGRLDWMALCASSSGWTLPAGQADYVAANAALDAWAQRRAGGATRVVAIDWGAWADTGMAAASQRAAEPVDEGETLVLPMLDRRRDKANGETVLTARWSPASRWFLDQHRTRAGDALLPGTGHAELLAEAAQALGLAPVAVQDLRFLAPLRCPDAGVTRLRLRIGGGEEMRPVEIEAAPPGEDWQVMATAQLGSHAKARGRLDQEAIAARLPAPEALARPQEAHLDFGAQWRVTGEARLGQGEGLARLRLPPGSETGMALHPGLLDIATGWAISLIDGYDPARFWVPAGYGTLRLHAPLPTEILSHVRLTGQEDGAARFDVVLATPEGQICAEIEGFALHRLAGELRFATAAQAEAGPVQPPEIRLGIRRAEGGRAFIAAMGAGLPQIAMTALPLPDLIAVQETAPPLPVIAAPETAELQPEARFETETEARLAKHWAALLGVEGIGPDDSFFDLGGHSLTAVRLFAAIRRETGTALPISALFETPTIRGLAARLDAKSPNPASPAAPALAAVPESHTHLVPLGRAGTGMPFYVAAGMFGNVMNLRHLAQHLRADRPVWGLQARGVAGDAAPHDSFEDAARDCLAEMRKVHPGGPWMIGGYSGGGITAFEMARQLQAAGEEVAAVMLLDSPLPVRPTLSLRDRLAIQAIELRRAGPLYPALWAGRRLRWEIDRRRYGREAGTPAASEAEAAVENAFYAASAAYELRCWDGPLTLFRPPLTGRWRLPGGRLVNIDRRYVIEDNGWRRWAPNLDVVEVPGDHDSMVLEPNVRALAARIRTRLAALDPDGPRLQAAE